MTQGAIQFVPAAATRDRLQPLSLITAVAEYGNGLINSAAAPPQMHLHAPGVSIQVDPWTLWEHLQEFAVATSGGASATFKIPDPQDVLPLIQIAQAQWLNVFRMSDEALGQHVKGSEQLTLADLRSRVDRSAYAFLTVLTVMELYVRHRWQILPQPPDGALAGLAQQVELWSARLPPVAQRHPESQKILDRFGVQIERLAGHRIPHLEHPGARARTGHRARELFDGSRLERYFKRPGCIGIRALRRNRYHYIALMFTADRVVVDTAQKENRFFLMRGPRADVLAAINAALASGQIKQQLEQLPCCVGGHEHDPQGEQQLEQFLA